LTILVHGGQAIAYFRGVLAIDSVNVVFDH
jgi:hypothetical protein